MIKFKQWLENQKTHDLGTPVPSVLYHNSPWINRQSILQHGLQGSKYDQTVDLSDPLVTGGTYLTNKPDYSSDVWEVDVRGLDVYDDWTGHAPVENEGEHWFVVYQDIPPNRIKLVAKDPLRPEP